MDTSTRRALRGVGVGVVADLARVATALVLVWAVWQQQPGVHHPLDIVGSLLLGLA